MEGKGNQRALDLHCSLPNLHGHPDPSPPFFCGSQDARTSCGVMYEVVSGIPKQEGMQQPPKIPANPSFVELDEDENAVEKFKTAMSSVTSILSLDRLKQVSGCRLLFVARGKC